MTMATPEANTSTSATEVHDTSDGAAVGGPVAAKPERRAAAIEAAAKAMRAAGIRPDGEPPAEVPADAPEEEAPETERPKRDAREKPKPPKGKTPAAPPPAADEPPPEENPVRAAIELRARARAQKTRDSARAEAEQMRAQAAKELEEARALAAKYGPVAGAVEKLRAGQPTAAFKELGLSHRDVFDRALEEAGQEADPLARAQKVAQAAADRVEALEKRLAEREETDKKSAAAQTEEARWTGYAEQVAAHSDEFPGLVARFEGDAEGLIRETQRVIEKYYNSDYFQQTGKQITMRDAAVWLESREQELYKKRAGAQQAAAPSEVAPAGARANTGRSLSTATTSQKATLRVGTTKSIEERRASAAEAAARVLREHEKAAG
jgi:hypothetical protein